MVLVEIRHKSIQSFLTEMGFLHGEIYICVMDEQESKRQVYLLPTMLLDSFMKDRMKDDVIGFSMT